MSFVYLLSSKHKYSISFFFVPNTWQTILENAYITVYRLLKDNLKIKGEVYFSFVSLIFIFILLSNLIGMIPYSYTTTSHVVVTFILSFSLFLGINVIGTKKNRMNMFSLFIPANTSFILAIILVPIEFISYLAKPISLGVRLFINLMAGHTLLKVIVGFSWDILSLENVISLIYIIPLILLIILMGLELCVAFIQAYVFIVLICIYLNDSIHLH